MEQSPDDAETRHETDERECEQVASREMGNCSVKSLGELAWFA